MACFIALSPPEGLRVFNTNRIVFIESPDTSFRYQELTTQAHQDTYTVSEPVSALLSHATVYVFGTTLDVTSVGRSSVSIPLDDIILIYPDPAKYQRTFIKYQLSGKREVVHVNEDIFSIMARINTGVP